MSLHNASSLAGRRFGKLVALSPTNHRANNHIVWQCACDCGKTCEIKASSLRGGATKSCGCLRKETPAREKAKNIAGIRFGRLLAVSPTTDRVGSNIVWYCECDCGKSALVPTGRLTKGATKSCGCLARELARKRKTTHGLFGSKAYNHLYYSLRKAQRHKTQVSPITAGQINERITVMGDRCYYCGGLFEHIDHLVPLARGGAHVIGNLFPSCAYCNISKNDSLLGAEWIPPRARDWT